MMTVGGPYGRTKRVISGIASGRYDEKPWLGYVERALSSKPIPSHLRPYIAPFSGTSDQRRVLMRMLRDTRRRLSGKPNAVLEAKRELVEYTRRKLANMPRMTSKEIEDAIKNIVSKASKIKAPRSRAIEKRIPRRLR